jgi:serine/threonine protein kinase
MGVVYKARHTGLDRLVALKILPKQAAQDPALGERFLREARTLAKLNHPNIVAVYDFGQTGGLYYFLMEFVDGENLRQTMHARQLSSKEALQIITQICQALQFAHDEGVVHRDIKPENILLDKKGLVKVADFGLAKLLGPSLGDWQLTGTRQVMGTLHYMAPEQAEKPLEVDHRADIYSLGVVFYELLTGELPLGRFDPPSQKAPGDLRLDEVVLRALAKEPVRRYQQAIQMKTDVDGISKAIEQPALPPDRFWSNPEIPAATLIVTSVSCIAAFLSLLVISWLVEEIDGVGPLEQLIFVLGILIAVVIFWGAFRMFRLEAYRLAIISCILAMLPCSFGWIMTVWPGIWALIVLHIPAVKAAFQLKEAEYRRALAHVGEDMDEGLRD